MDVFCCYVFVCVYIYVVVEKKGLVNNWWSSVQVEVVSFCML